MPRIICPWCGTHYTEFQPNCENCGGSLPFPQETDIGISSHDTNRLPLAVPAEKPRGVPTSHLWKILSTKAGPWIGGIFSILGFVFGIVGFGLTVTVVAIFVGIPFMFLGVVFSGIGLPLFIVGYSRAQRTLGLLRNGSSVEGKIHQVVPNYQMTINGRHPWKISYAFELHGRKFTGTSSTLSAIPHDVNYSGQPVFILYNPENPEENTIFPNPFGYYP